MRTSQYLLITQKETPADAEVISHQLMLRAGMIKKLASGLYSWLPLGLRVLRKVEKIVREEMNKSGALEVLMPNIQPAELWQETGRWDKFGPLLLKIKDQNEREFCYGPTHEEVITDIVRNEIHSYKQLPINLFQIQTKFRDEIRPRFGVMRAREFLMKDSYSFHLDQKSLEQTYQVMYQTYSSIFERIGLKYRAVFADTGSIGGSVSQEFHVLADSGEDLIFYSDESKYAANIEQAEAITVDIPLNPTKELQKIDTGSAKTIEEVSKQLKISPEKMVKTLIVKGRNENLVALVLRGDHVLNPIKAQKHPLIACPFTMATDQEIQNAVNCAAGYLGPIGLKIPVIVDRGAAVLSDFVCGANETQKHYINANWHRDVALVEIADLRNVVEGDLSPDGKGRLKPCRGIEVGHIFQLGDNYSKSMKASVSDEQGKAITLLMGCYGIGVSRIVAAAIEQNYDKNGIIWPESIAPFQISIVPVGMHRSPRVKEAAENLYQKLINQGFEVLLDDRDERPGSLFADMDLIGIPHRIIIGERGLENGTIEYKSRRDEKARDITFDEFEKIMAR